MQTKKRRFKPTVIEQLIKKPQRFEFFQAVYLLETWLTQNGHVQENGLDDKIIFRNSLSLSFPASQIENLHIDCKIQSQQPGSSIPEDLNSIQNIVLTPAFMGFLGVNGSLPNHYTEQIAAHLFDTRNDASRAFLDVFSSRAVSKFYRAWIKYRLPLRFTKDGHDLFLPLLLSLSGLGYPDLQDRLNLLGEGVLDDSIAHFAAAVRHKPVSCAVIQKILAAYFVVPVKIQPFIGSWYRVPRSQLTRLGAMNSILGVNALVGERVWQRDLRLRIQLGALNKSQFELFLPSGKSARALNSLLMLLTQHEFEYEIKLVLMATYVQAIKLDPNPENNRLGWDTFLISHPESNDRDDVAYTINAII